MKQWFYIKTPAIGGRMKLFKRTRGQTAPCPVRALCDRLNTQGWTVAMPFPIPDACHARTCGHTSDDAWALDYAAHAQRVTRGVEDGRYTFEDVQAFTATVFRDGLPEDLRDRP